MDTLSVTLKDSLDIWNFIYVKNKEEKLQNND